MPETQSMESVLRAIIQKFGISTLTNGKLLISAYADLSQNKQEQRLIRYFAEAGGHTALLGAAKLSPAMQKTCFEQTVKKITASMMINEDAVRKVCNAFWAAVYGAPMEQPPAPRAVQVQPVRQSEMQHPKYKSEQSYAKSIAGYCEADRVPKEKVYSYCDKNTYFISKEEAQRGGNIPVYYTADMLYINVPPNVRNGTQIRPVNRLSIINADDSELLKRYITIPELRKRISDHSDGLIRDSLEQLSRRKMIAVQDEFDLLLFICKNVLAFVAGIVVFKWGCSVLFPEKCAFDGLINTVIYAIKLYILSFSSIKDTLRTLFLWGSPIALTAWSVVDTVRHYSERRKLLQEELERRKTLPLRK